METLPVLEARVRLHSDKTGRHVKHVGFAELLIAGAFVIKGIRIMKGPRDPEPFLVFPAERGKGENSGKWYDIAHPSTKFAREVATKVILDAFAKIAGGAP